MGGPRHILYASVDEPGNLQGSLLYIVFDTIPEFKTYIIVAILLKIG